MIDADEDIENGILPFTPSIIDKEWKMRVLML